MTRLTANSSFVKLVTNTSKTQAIAILETVTIKQTDCIGEIILNLTLGNLVKLDERVEKILHTSRRILNKLKDRKISSLKRSSIIKTHPKIVLQVLKLVRDKLIKSC